MKTIIQQHKENEFSWRLETDFGSTLASSAGKVYTSSTGAHQAMRSAAGKMLQLAPEVHAMPNEGDLLVHRAPVTPLTPAA